MHHAAGGALVKRVTGYAEQLATSHGLYIAGQGEVAAPVVFVLKPLEHGGSQLVAGLKWLVGHG
jgi:hypothetical protein